MINLMRPETEKKQEDLKLRENFIAILSQFSTEKERIGEVFDKLVASYSSKERYYHNLSHIQAMLEFLEKREAKIKNFNAVFLAAWYHDAVYNPQSKTNEADSAKRMEQDLATLGINDQELIQAASQLILATQKHQIVPNNADCGIFLDSDLAILSRSEHEYAVYAAGIRQEYIWVPEDEYKKGRKVVLESFLKRERIYFSEDMEEAELVAKKNIEAEIRRLG